MSVFIVALLLTVGADIDPACQEQCKTVGACSLIEGRCRPTSHADCEASTRCKDDGECHFDATIRVCGPAPERAKAPTRPAVEVKPVVVVKPAPKPVVTSRPKPAATPKSYSSGPHCKKGCPCGNACIPCSKRCRK